MNAEERELFQRSVEAAVASADIDTALTELGWQDAFEDDARTAVSVLFDALGRANATSSALEAIAPSQSGLLPPDVLKRLAVAHELIGAGRAMLELARTHAVEREQFGQPIATFQAVRHRLAEALIAIETAEAMLAEAWDDSSPETAAMAKAVAGRSAKTAARHCQQVLAGIGFTTEHPFHLYFKRVLVLDQLLGSSKSLTRALGQQLIESRRLPTPVPL